MMNVIQGSIHIDKPLEEVWDFTHDFDKVPLWYSSAEIYEQIGDEPFGKGTRIKDVSRFLGKRIETTIEVSEYEEHDHTTYRTVEAPFDYAYEWRYEPEGDGTLLSFRGESEPMRGFFGRLADPVVMKLYRREIVSSMGKLKDLLEA
jgi:ligand-binding SRPBCC domain-containing protein